MKRKTILSLSFLLLLAISAALWSEDIKAADGRYRDNPLAAFFDYELADPAPGQDPDLIECIQPGLNCHVP